MKTLLFFLLFASLVATGCSREHDLNDRREMYRATTEMVRSRLQSASSAQFPALPDSGEYGYAEGMVAWKTDSVSMFYFMGNHSTVEGHVYARDSAGQLVHHTFSALVAYDDSAYKPQSGDVEDDITID